LWGITASDSPNGYAVWGGPPEMGPIDGTVVPSAAAGSLPFLTGPTLRVLKTIRRRYERTWSRYGFINAFNPMADWYDPHVIGIDTGITLLMAENLRTGFVWNTFMQNANVRRALERAGFARYGWPCRAAPSGAPRHVGRELTQLIGQPRSVARSRRSCHGIPAA